MKRIGNDLYMVAGNAEAIRVKLSREPRPGDKVIFEAVHRIGAAKPAIHIEADDWDEEHSVILSFTPEMTRDLEPRGYPYEITLDGPGRHGPRTVYWAREPDRSVRRLTITPRAVT